MWNFRTGKLLILPEDSSIVSVAFSPDDQLLLTATLGGKGANLGGRITAPWNGRQGTLARTRKVWQNPHPNKKIATIDFTSARKQAAPQSTAVTLE